MLGSHFTTPWGAWIDDVSLLVGEGEKCGGLVSRGLSVAEGWLVYLPVARLLSRVL